MSSSSTTQDMEDQWIILITFAARSLVYLTVLVVLVVIISLMWKLLRNYEVDATNLRQIRATETSGLLEKEKSVSFTYGSFEEDLESGICSSSSSSEDLYDAKICIVCYDNQRNCFFVPCGHCATCSDCAQRIMKEEAKNCPVCRRSIHKVRKLFK